MQRLLVDCSQQPDAISPMPMIQLLSQTIGLDKQTVIALDALRKQRNVADYAGDIIPPCFRMSPSDLHAMKRRTGCPICTYAHSLIVWMSFRTRKTGNNRQWTAASQ